MSVFAQPNGRWTAQIFSGPVRVERDDGSWAALDYSLVEDSGSVRPLTAAVDLTLSGGGSSPLATLEGEGSSGEVVSLGVGWSGTLPEAELVDNTATYPDAADGADVVVTALREGFSHSIVLDVPPAQAPVYRFPLDLSDGLTVSIADTGAINVNDAHGDLVFYAPRPRMWDSQVDPVGGVPSNVVPLDAQIVEGVGGGPELVITPDAEFLAASSTSYPVTVDPTWNWANGVWHQTWVQYNDYLETQYGSPELKVGTYNGSEIARTFLKFGVGGLSAYQVLAAELRMFNFYSGSCTGSTIYAQRLTQNWSHSTLTWANQPAATATGQVGLSAAHGYTSSCPGNYARWDVTAMTRAWATGTANYGLRLRAADENSIFSWRRYFSSFWSSIDAAQEPHLLVELNAKPNRATHVSPASGTITTDSTPRLVAKATDPDGDTVSLTFELWNKVHSHRRQVITSGFVASGTEVFWIPTALVSGEYHWRVAVKDAHGLWNGTWSPWSSIFVDTVAPTASSPKTNGSSTCGQVLGDSTPTLSVVLTDNLAGNLESDFEVYTIAGDLVANTNTTLAAKPSGQTFSYTIPTLADGSYRWMVRGWDTRLWGPYYTPSCTFTVDTTLPDLVDIDADGPYQVGVSGSFVADTTDSDVVAYKWGLNTDAPSTTVTTTAGGAKTISFTPTTFGPARLAVRSVDGADNLGPIRYADVWVDGGTAAHHWRLDETTGVIGADAIGSLDATFTGAYAWAGGRWAESCDEFGDCVPLDPTDHAITFTGAGSARTAGPAVNAAENFSVSAWVSLNTADTVQTFVAVSQDGGTRSSFKLGYIAGSHTWGFWMRDAQSSAWVRALTPAGYPIVRNDWVHLTGTYDAIDGVLRLYVDGDLAGTAVLGAPHTVTGDFRIGTSRENAADTMTWPGEVDDVRVFRGMLDDGQVLSIAEEARP